MGVLLIEDDDDDALIVEDLLAATSLDVRLVRGRTLGEGLQELSGSVDCVLLDLRLPDVVGLDTLRRGALLGGDFFDAVETEDGCLHVIVGDVSGRGPDGAALGAGLRIAWRSLTLSGAAGDLVLTTLERMIEHERQVPGMFATLCMLEIRPDRRALSLWRAGHPSPVLIDGASITSMPLERGGPPIGLFSGSEWPESEFQLPRGCSILLYTDGVIDGGDGGSGHLGEEGLRRLIADYVESEPGWRRDPHDLLRRLLTRTQELNGEDFSDDVAMLLLGPRDVPRGTPSQ